MRVSLLMCSLSIFCLTMFARPDAGAASFLIEAEGFQFHGGWVASPLSEALNREVLVIPGSGQETANAATAVNLPEGGVWNIWVRTRDYPAQQPGARRFRLVIDDTASEEAGNHGQAGFAWQNVLTLELESGTHLVQIEDTTQYFARCDAIFFTTEDTDPNDIADIKRMAAFRVSPERLEMEAVDPFAGVAAIRPEAHSDVAVLDNGRVRLTFQKYADARDGSRIVRRTELQSAEGWKEAPAGQGGERLYLLYSPAENIQMGYFPSWVSREHWESFEFQGQQLRNRVHPSNPFFAGEIWPLVAREARQIDEWTVSVTCETTGSLRATILWRLEPESREARASFSFRAPRDGCYSLVHSAFRGWDRGEVEFVQLPPLYQLQRVPEKPQMVTSSMAPHPFALVQVGWNGGSLTWGVLAEPEDMPCVWPSPSNAKCGFTLVNPFDQVQPTIFQPVLGLEDSKLAKGQVRRIRWRVLAYPGDWRQTMEYVSDSVMQVRDYRQPINVSLTEAALNIIDLIAHPDAGGWDPGLKGFWDIETPNMSKQAAPLAVISAAILTRDEGFYARRALPTIAFTLSRTRSDIIRGGVNRLGVPVHQQLNVPTLFYDANHWQGVDALLNALNPWLEEFIFPQGPEAESIRGEAWSTHFAQWRYRPDPELLKQVTEEADAFVRTNFLERHEQPIPFSTFYNFNYTPYWYDLVGLYEVTGKKEYLEVAELGAFCNTAGQWSHPPIPNGEFIVNPGSRMPLTSVDNDRHKGPIPFRVGFPPGPDAFPEKRVPAWQVSPNGLSLENPSTYFNARRDTCMNIMMSNFAPHQLRVYRHTGREILRTYARNAVIGRFANYPGYYLPDFTDLPHQPRYPYEGPDITEFYYHHIPPHLAFALDFLVEQAIVRSNGRISFPWVKQRGYVWFNNRVYGLKPGSIYGEDGAVLWLDRRLYDPRTKDVDWLAASSGDRFWLILMNQTEEALGVPVKVDAGLTGVRMDAACRIYEGGTAEPREEMRVPERIAVPAKGVVAISIPTEPREGWPSVPPLKKGHVLEKLGAPWGDLHAFRIRSPFGSDGLYVVLVNEPVEGGEVRFRLSGPSGQKEVVTGEYPYEWIVYPLPLDQPIRCDVEVRRPGAAAVRGVVEFGQE